MVEVTKTYPHMSYAAGHKWTCNLCHIDKNPADGCNCGAELVDLIRDQMMSTDHPVSDWEIEFAGKIMALPMFSNRIAAEQAALRRGIRMGIEASAGEADKRGHVTSRDAIRALDVEDIAKEAE